MLNRLGQMLLTDIIGRLKIGDGEGDLQDARVGAGGEPEAVGDHFDVSQ